MVENFMLPEQIRKYIIKPTLEVIDMWTESTEILVFGTGLMLSEYASLKKHGEEGLGFWRYTPSDYKNICIYLRNNFNKGLMDKILSACYYSYMPLDPSVIMSNIKFACLICCVHYSRVKEPPPKPGNAIGMAEYFKAHYSSQGGSDVPKTTDLFSKVIEGAQ